MNDSIAFYFNRGFGGFGTKVAIGEKDQITGEHSFATDFTFEKLSPGETIPPGAKMDISDEALQEMLDEIWKMGFRPTGVKTGDETIEALRNHIDNLTSALQRDDGMLDRMLTIIDLNIRDSVVAENNLRHG